MKALLATVISLALTTVVIGNAYYQKKQFYPSIVYLTNSNPSMAVMYLQAFILVLLVGKLLRKIFFGQLRPAEFEHLIERSWYAITETCLAFTVFRDDFNPKFIALFTLLLFLKAFHWLAEDRVDYMERSPVIGWLFHVRILTLLMLLAHADFYFIHHAYQFTASKGPSVQLVFGFEYSILIIMIVNILIKYVLHTIDSRWEAPWESKAAVLLYTELAINFLKVLLYIGFVAVMVRIYTLPLFAFRPMYETMRSFKKAYNDVVLSRRAIRNMNTLYPDATPAELAAADNECIICREEMHTGAKKLPCNHIFHAACLRLWFQRQQTCPTCRLNVLRAPAPEPAAAPAPPAAQPPPPAPGPVPPPFPNMPNLPNMHNMPPPPPMMAWGMPPPPPPRPASLANLTTAELQRMEGNERRNIEARLQLLREIQAMLDASVLLMQQYSTVVANLPQNNATVSTQTDIKIEVVNPPTSASASQAKSEPDVVPTTSSYKPPAVPSTSKADLTDDASMQPDTTTDSTNRKRGKISEMPMRPQSAYMMWLNSAREQIKLDNPGMKINDFAKKAGEIWKSMKDKTKWEEKAAKAKEQYAKDLESHNARESGE
ncbi:E3 ubiquitin-protein ligase synoviolin B isoform X2 [Trichoplusia ni]|uniref:RING-type E3 ubiquitin transferase n=1 Tax=Trichoplusia ni TaxID=7111 RepID=A0A7E5WQW5_TRINI|nr:E3 ubiquitin-protein ligase synoviolin B isoform X2 [Trichoplusia ni]